MLLVLVSYACDFFDFLGDILGELLVGDFVVAYLVSFWPVVFWLIKEDDVEGETAGGTVGCYCYVAIGDGAFNDCWVVSEYSRILLFEMFEGHF